MPFRRLIAIAWLSFALLLLITNAADAYPTLVARDGNLPPCSPSGIKMLIPSPLHRYDKTLFATTKPLEWPDQPLLRSTDNGATWTPIAVINGMTAIDLEFSLAYAADHTLYMSLQGVFADSPAAQALVRSTDAGATWELLPPILVGHIIPGGLGIAVVDQQRLFLSKGGGPPNYESEKGIFYSTNGGQTWTHRYTGGVVDLALSSNYAVDHTLFFSPGAYRYNGGVFKSTDDALTWQPSYEGLPIGSDGGTGAFWFSPNYALDHLMFVVSWGALYRSTNSGGHWERVSPGPTPWGDMLGFAISPRYPQDHTIWLLDGSVGQIVTHDGGATWQNFPVQPLRVQPLSATEAYCPGSGECGIELFVRHFATDAHDYIYKSGDYGQTWRCLDGSIPTAPSSPPIEIPEPSTLLLLGGGVAALAGYAQHRRSRRAARR